VDTTYVPHPWNGAYATVQIDGKLLVGVTYICHGLALTRIARLNTDGTSDTTLNVGQGANTA